MRAPQARRHGAGDRLQRRPGGAGAWPSRSRVSSGCMSSTSTAPSPASRSMARRSRRSSSATQESGAARRRHPQPWPDRGLARQGAGPRHPRHRGGARSGAGAARPAGCFPARSPSASTPRAARSRSKAGPKRPSSASIELAQQFEDAGVAAIIYTDIDRDGVLTGINWEATLATSPHADRPFRSSPRAGSPRWPTSCA